MPERSLNQQQSSYLTLSVLKTLIVFLNHTLLDIPTPRSGSSAYGLSHDGSHHLLKIVALTPHGELNLTKARQSLNHTIHLTSQPLRNLIVSSTHNHQLTARPLQPQVSLKPHNHQLTALNPTDVLNPHNHLPHKRPQPHSCSSTTQSSTSRRKPHSVLNHTIIYLTAFLQPHSVTQPTQSSTLTAVLNHTIINSPSSQPFAEPHNHLPHSVLNLIVSSTTQSSTSRRKPHSALNHTIINLTASSTSVLNLIVSSTTQSSTSRRKPHSVSTTQSSTSRRKTLTASEPHESLPHSVLNLIVVLYNTHNHQTYTVAVLNHYNHYLTAVLITSHSVLNHTIIKPHGVNPHSVLNHTNHLPVTDVPQPHSDSVLSTPTQSSNPSRGSSNALTHSDSQPHKSSTFTPMSRPSILHVCIP
ncbi:hypothetical protein C7M84_014839 [Penaeus vannamei]|uniref:Uncharacterized protein n=1 Tax=Penaeus vannamei TaxID=6689 RepID=A0A3R7LYZ8_PENVA|nr:hypothetical protein C7M84_014839 [Penaeus vannamei]